MNCRSFMVLVLFVLATLLPDGLCTGLAALSVCIEDHNRYCNLWAELEECDFNPTYMAHECPKSCKPSCQCDNEVIDKDSDCLCLERAQLGQCANETATFACRKACGERTRLKCNSKHYLENPDPDRIEILRSPETDVVPLLSTKSPYLTKTWAQCKEGFEPDNRDDQFLWVCDRNEKWSKSAYFGKMPNCTRIRCEDPELGLNANISKKESQLFGATIDYFCLEGYEPMTGDMNRTCQGNKKWSGNAPFCTGISCGDPPDFQNVVRWSSRIDYLSVTSYQCESGYEKKSGVFIKTCQSDGNWTSSGDDPQCKKLDCGLPSTSSATEVTFDDTRFEAMAVYNCKIGYDYIRGTTKRKCTAEKKWENYGQTTDLYCRVKDCGTPPSMYHAIVIEQNGTTYGRYVTYGCMTVDYAVAGGSPHKICDANGTWVGRDLICEKVKLKQLAARPRKNSKSAKEAPASVATGTSFMVGILLMIGLVIALDLATIERQLQVLTRNCAHCRKRWDRFRKQRIVERVAKDLEGRYEDYIVQNYRESSDSGKGETISEGSSSGKETKLPAPQTRLTFVEVNETAQKKLEPWKAKMIELRKFRGRKTTAVMDVPDDSLAEEGQAQNVNREDDNTNIIT